MPKKFDGENSKVTAARARKECAKVSERQQKEAAKEEEFWKDDDKNVQKKMLRKDEKEKKKMEQLTKKATLKSLAEQELESIKVESKQAPSKITRLQIQAEQEKREACAKGVKAGASAKIISSKISEAPIPENINRIEVEGEVARTVDEAIRVLKIDDGSSVENERHPEKRMKAAYTSFEEKNLPRLKEENPNARLSQIKQMLHKEWLKSAENPLNSAFSVHYNKK